jgi:hypothetical protein
MKTFYNPNEFNNKKKKLNEIDETEETEETEPEIQEEKKEKKEIIEKKKIKPPKDYEEQENNFDEKPTEKDMTYLENNFKTNLVINDNKKIENISFDVKDSSTYPRPELYNIFSEVEQPDVSPLFNKFLYEVLFF